jgi:transposase
VATDADPARKALVPARQLGDAGYVRGGTLPASRARGIASVGPIQADGRWRATEATGFEAGHFAIDRERRVVSCPRGKASAHRGETATTRGPLGEVRVAPAACAAGTVRAQCTRAETAPRGPTLPPRAVHAAIRAARARQETAAFAAAYAGRAGVEGTLAQGVRAFGLRQARDRGLAKTHLPHLATAAAVDVARVRDWRDGRPRAQTRRSPFARLAAAA